MTTKRTKPGPKPDTLKIEGDWKDAVAKMLRAPTQEAARPKQKRKKK